METARVIIRVHPLQPCYGWQFPAKFYKQRAHHHHHIHNNSISTYLWQIPLESCSTPSGSPALQWQHHSHCCYNQLQLCTGLTAQLTTTGHQCPNSTHQDSCLLHEKSHRCHQMLAYISQSQFKGHSPTWCWLVTTQGNHFCILSQLRSNWSISALPPKRSRSR